MLVYILEGLDPIFLGLEADMADGRFLSWFVRTGPVCVYSVELASKGRLDVDYRFSNVERVFDTEDLSYCRCF